MSWYEFLDDNKEEQTENVSNLIIDPSHEAAINRSKRGQEGITIEP